MTALVLAGFLTCVFLQWAFWLGMFSRLACHKPASLPAEEALLPPVSVVICAYNEEVNLRRHLPHILAQDYPEFEVLVVDDASTDGSPALLADLAQRHPQLRILPLSYPDGRTSLGKKHALSQGITHAWHDTLLVTDADCQPASPYWIRLMAAGLHDGKEIVLGYGPYTRQPGLLNGFIRFEAVYTAIQYLSFALWGIPYMGVGRNMLYQRKLFWQAGGFKRHQRLPSGDDDLFVNAVARKGNTGIVLHPESFMYSPAKETLGGYFRQKNRHLTTGRHYRPLHQLLLGLLSASHFGLYVLGWFSLAIKNHTLLVIILLFTTLIVKGILFARMAIKWGERDLAYNFPLWDGFYLLYYILLSPALFWGKTKEWK